MLDLRDLFCYDVDNGAPSLLWFLRHGANWESGFGWWEGKPALGYVVMYYDGFQLTIHIGPFWIGCRG